MTEVEIFKQSLDVSRIVMLITVVMAITSIVFSALAMAFQRSHNRRSIRPICSIRKRAENGKVYIFIKNCGLGPMILKNFNIVDSNNTNINGEKNPIESEGYCIHKTAINDEVALAVNEEYDLLEMTNGNIQKEEQISESLNAYKIWIVITDVYEKEMYIEREIGKIQASAF